MVQHPAMLGGRRLATMSRILPTHRLGPVALVLLALIGACGSTPRSEDPMLTATDPRAGVARRATAIRDARSAASGDHERIGAVSRMLRDIVWDVSQPDQVRVAAMRALLDDKDPKVVAEARSLGRLVLPTERDREMVVLLSKAAGERGWKEYSSALVRSFARPVLGVKDDERAERVSLLALSEGAPLHEAIFGVFVDPGVESSVVGKGTRLDGRVRARIDAWDLLARIDPSGAARRELIERVDASADPDPLLAVITASRRELRVVPLAGEEILWLASLRDFAKPGRREWWDQTRAAVDRVSTEHALQTRHLESLRWASLHRPELLAATRDELLSQLRSTVGTRPTIPRSWGGGSPEYGERLTDSEAKLSWADALTLAVTDAAVRSPGLADRLFLFAEQDRADKTSEYGGVVLLREDSARPGEAVLYPPRAGQRRGDREFVASDDLLDASIHASAHFHFHVQRLSNAEVAGPSPADLAYAKRFGRGCLVFTSVGAGKLNADYYQPDGVVIDLGVLAATP